MPIKLLDHPALPHCGGEQWYVEDRDQLVQSVALALIGHAKHVHEIILGTQARPLAASQALRDRLRAMLLLPADAEPYHRDGLLFETICWVAAILRATDGEATSSPHRRSTQQGADILQVSFDQSSRTVSRMTVFEQKCTEQARTKFRDEVIPAFEDWLSGERDDELLQTAMDLLSRFELTDSEKTEAYSKIVDHSATALRAALTVSPHPFDRGRCTRLFKDYDQLTKEMERRFGDTFPMSDIRPWFDSFSADVWQAIEAMNV